MNLWDKIKATCLRSLTVAWSYALGLVSLAMMKLDDLAALVNDSTFVKQVGDFLGTDPKALGKWLMIVSAVTIASRLRGIVAKKPAT